MEYDELELDTLGEQKTALFVIISDTDATFNFVVSIMYSQLFNLLCDRQTMFIMAGFRFMCGACWMSSVILGRFHSLRS